MPISQLGAINTTALQVPNAYNQIVPPAAQHLNGVASNVAGIVGAAAWGPVNSPVVIGNLTQYVALFGPIQPRKYDAGTLLSFASQQGANNFRVVRVTDGTDTAASIAVQAGDITFTSKYTGSFGNGIAVAVAAGSQAGTWTITVGAPGLLSEQFANIGAGLAGNALWVAIANAINSGTTAIRGPSNIIVATAGAGTSAPTSATYSLAGGTDGYTGITGTTLVGVDVAPRKGMFALRGTGCSVAALTDCDQSSTWSSQLAYGLSEGTYMIGVDVAGQGPGSVATVISDSATSGHAGPGAYAFKLCMGDWVSWLDATNNVTRLISPQGYFVGVLTALTPNQSSLNKQAVGIVATQTSMANQVYADADLELLGAAGIDLIANPSPGGNYFSAQFGRNVSTNPLTNGDNYTRMTNYIAATLNAGMGIFVGQAQAANAIGFAGTPSANAFATLIAFFSNLLDQNLIGTPTGPVAANVQLNSANYPQQRVSQGYLQAVCAVQYQSIIQYLLINVQGGQSVQITATQTVPVPT